MYRYEIIRIEIKGLITSRPKEDYREIIKEKAKEGWRLKQLFAPAIEGAGAAPYIDLIFEKKTE